MSFSPHLRSVAHKIKTILKEEGVIGSFALSDGLGMSEYVMGLDIPDWSTFRHIKSVGGKEAAHIQVYMASKPDDTKRTINAIFGQADVMGQLAIGLIDLRKDLQSKVPIDSQEGEYFPMDDQ